VDQLLARLAQPSQKKTGTRSILARTAGAPGCSRFFAAHGLIACAAIQFRHIAGHGFRETMQGASLFVAFLAQVVAILRNSTSWIAAVQSRVLANFMFNLNMPRNSC